MTRSGKLLDDRVLCATQVNEPPSPSRRTRVAKDVCAGGGRCRIRAFGSLEFLQPLWTLCCFVLVRERGNENDRE